MSIVYVGNATADPRGSRRLPCRVPRAIYNMYSHPGTREQTFSGASPRGSSTPHMPLARATTKVMHATRVARRDQLKSHAQSGVRGGWGDNNDIALDGLICNVRSMLSYRIVACVGGQIEDLSVVVYDDADFAGCAESHMSTS